MGYTSETAMEEQGLRDVERWKDKIEVRLDNRQVFFLFFGSALVACLLFILGVIVGKRLESRGRATAPEIEDPLALLDRVATQSAATAAVGPVMPAPPVPARPASAAAAAALPPKSDPKPEPKPEAKREAAPEPKTAPPPAEVKVPPAPAPSAVAKAPAAASAPAAKPSAAAPAPAVAKVAPAPPKTTAPSPAPASPVAPAPATPTAATSPPPANETPGSAESSAAAATPPKPKGRFTLQVRAFQDRAEAEAFSKQFAAERPFIVQADVPGKGLWYRIRIGDFHSYKEAVDAKLVFEKRYKMIALVVGPL